MLNPEKLLGGLLGQSLGASRGWGTQAKVGLGLLGVAVAAAEHFMNNTQTGAGPGAPPPPPPRAGAPPPTPRSAVSGVAPPPPPGAVSPSPTDAGQAAPQAQDAVLLIRAMIAAAHADGRMDAQERETILSKLEKLNLSLEERRFIDNELLSPASLESIVSQAGTPEMAQQIYAVSLMAITVDSEAERQYMELLAQKLDLAPARAAEIRRELGLQPR